MTALLLVQGTLFPMLAVADIVLPPTLYLTTRPPPNNMLIVTFTLLPSCHGNTEPSNIPCASQRSLLIHGRPRPQDLGRPRQPARFGVLKNIAHTRVPP